MSALHSWSVGRTDGGSLCTDRAARLCVRVAETDEGEWRGDGGREGSCFYGSINPSVGWSLVCVVSVVWCDVGGCAAPLLH